jgi:hypothetical protein
VPGVEGGEPKAPHVGRRCDEVVGEADGRVRSPVRAAQLAGSACDRVGDGLDLEACEETPHLLAVSRARAARGLA